MLETDKAEMEEEREEGEIMDDDLEDVSDCSMSPSLPFGKSVAPPELLSAVCLSSISSGESGANEEKNYRRCYCNYERCHRKRKRIKTRREYNLHKRVVGPDKGADSDKETVDPRYAKKLRVALRRESSRDMLHNNLRTRLKAFIECASHSEEETDIPLKDLTASTIENESNSSTNKAPLDVDLIIENETIDNDKETAAHDKELIDDDFDLVISEEEEESSKTNAKLIVPPESDLTIDPELRELRLAALKSFVLENHKKRRRKAAANNQPTDIDKENDKSRVNNDITENMNMPVDKAENQNGVEGKTDFTASAEVEKVHIGNDVEEDADILRAMLLASMSEKLAGKTTEVDMKPTTFEFSKTLSEIRKVEKSRNQKNSLSVTITKPLFRTIKNDLYTITNSNCTHDKKSSAKKQMELLNNVVVKPLIINVNDSDSDLDVSNINENNKVLKDTVAEFLRKQRAEVEATIKTPEKNGNKIHDPFIEKSVVKLLPKSQQLEYQRLKQQLLNAHKKTKPRRSSQQLSETTKQQNFKKVSKFKMEIKPRNTATSPTVDKSSQDKKNATSTSALEKTLNELQIRKNGRLQMKGKYQALVPLMQKINQASTERRQHELEIKRLLLQIQKERTKLAMSHKSFTDLVHQLLQEKSNIDKRVFQRAKTLQNTSLTTVPNKPEEGAAVATSEAPNIEIEGTLPKKAEVSRESLSEKIEVKESSSDIGEPVLFEPNDITRNFVEQPTAESVAFTKYISPLDNREGGTDPLTTICPYDLLGVCKDEECLYLHCS